MTDLPQPCGASESGATAINNNGLITGTLITVADQSHAFLFDTAIHDPGTLVSKEPAQHG
jgi:probable HAF family extracellular repeat protein